GPTRQAVYLDFRDAIERLGKDVIEARYGNLFQMYERIVDDDPYKVPMMIYPAVHYTMGGLWVDYNLMSNLPGLHVLGEANFSDHGANRLGASALMQGLADGYFVIPYTLSHYFGSTKFEQVDTNHAEFKKAEEDAKARIDKLLGIKGKRTVDEFHRQLGLLCWDKCGMARDEKGLKEALQEIPAIRDEFWQNVTVTGAGEDFNQSLEKAGRVADFLEFAELLVTDALHREESCGGHFREEHQTEDGEAKRDDERFAYVGAWEFKGVGEAPELHKEPLAFEEVHLATRSYK
ncbi:MAG: FAD-binding protein, partial [Candidatus Hydrogenedentes bacterium]|nr:FAD-binding protein [Candidatus Hydrogenedentota bacterium]